MTLYIFKNVLRKKLEITTPSTGSSIKLKQSKGKTVYGGMILMESLDS
jgi:hypothetical protein